MKFIANDGTIFDNQKDCEMYENHSMTIHDVVNVLRTFVHLYDRAKESFDIPESANLSDENWFLDFIGRIERDDCYYFRIDCDEATWKTVYDILEEEGSAEIPKHPGLYWWDDEWISYKDDKQRFENRWKGIAY
jgi:hypothetical protein